MVEQGSKEWHALRCGKVTASRVSDVIARIKSGYGASRANYMAELVIERLTGVQAEGYTSEAMKWGKEQERIARADYERRAGDLVTQVAFVDHPRIPMAGCSPDGLVGTDGFVEAKCPNSATHIETLLGGSIPKAYRTQMVWVAACTGRRWCDFISYDPRMPKHLQLFTQRVTIIQAEVDEMELEVIKFLRELETQVASINAKFGAI